MRTQEDNAQTRRHKTPLPPINPSFYPLCTDPSTDPNYASCATLSHGTRCTVRVAYSITNCQNKMGGRARFFLPTTRKRGKKWIIALSCENETKKSKFATRQICFWFLSYFLYTCFSTVVISQEINFITDKKYLPVFVFLFFLFEGLTLLLTFALTVFPYSYLTKNNLCILTLSIKSFPTFAYKRHCLSPYNNVQYVLSRSKSESGTYRQRTVLLQNIR